MAIIAQLNCHQHIMEALDQALTEGKYLQIPSEAWISEVFVSDYYNSCLL